MNTTTGHRDYYKWTKPAVSESQLLSKTSNVSTIVSKRQSSSGDHVTLWTAERILSGALVPLIPLAALAPSQPVEYLLAFIITLHSHWFVKYLNSKLRRRIMKRWDGRTLWIIFILQGYWSYRSWLRATIRFWSSYSKACCCCSLWFECHDPWWIDVLHLFRCWISHCD